MITVVLADDHHLVRQGIRALLEKDENIEVAGEAEDGLEAVRLVEQLVPDILILDIAMPRLNGIQAINRVRLLNVPTQIIMLSMHADATLVRQALQNGARGYLIKRSVTEELHLAIQAAQRGEVYLSPAVGTIVTDHLTSQLEEEPTTAYDTLSPREREVLQLIAEGNTNNAIAQALDISVKTVEKHRSSIMSKLDIHDLAGLIRVAIKQGLIFLDE